MTLREQELAKKLTQLAPQVNETMICEAVLALAVNYQTVKRYLKGNVGKEPTGKKLVEFFQSKISVAA